MGAHYSILANASTYNEGTLKSQGLAAHRKSGQAGSGLKKVSACKHCLVSCLLGFGMSESGFRQHF